jgi:hypothetical protein
LKRIEIRPDRNRAAVGVIVLALAACSSGSDLAGFTTDGVITPAGGCALDPTEFSNAQSLGTYGSGACTVRDAWKITAMRGIQFSQPAILNCATANGLNSWIKDYLMPAAQDHYQAKVVELTVAASYACRPRNGRSGAKLSEHGFGNAIDVSGLTLDNGKQINVEQDYYSSRFLKQVRNAACTVFRTVLGPGSDPSHRDHFHFDMANRRSGQHFCH